MKKTLLAVAIPTLALTGCFGSGTDKATYVVPTPQVKPVPNTHTQHPHPKQNTNKPNQNIRTPSPSISGNHNIAGNPNKPDASQPTPKPNPNTGSQPTPQSDAGSSKPTPKPNTDSANASGSTNTSFPEPNYSDYTPAVEPANPQTKPNPQTTKPEPQINRQAQAQQVYEKAKKAVTDEMYKNVAAAQKELIGIKNDLETYIADSSTILTFIDEEIKKSEKLIESVQTELKNPQVEEDDKARYNQMIMLEKENITELNKDKEKLKMLISEANKAIIAVGQKETINKIKGGGKEFNALVEAATNKLAADDEAKSADTSIPEYNTIHGFVNPDLVSEKALTGQKKSVVKTADNERNLAELIKNADNRVSVSLKNAVHGILDGKRPEFFYQGYRTPIKDIQSIQDANKLKKDATQAVYTGDAFVKTDMGIIKGESKFNVRFGASPVGNIDGEIRYSNKTINLNEGVTTRDSSSNNYVFKNTVAGSGVRFQGTFYGPMASELAGYFEEQDEENRKGTFGAAKQEAPKTN